MSSQDFAGNDRFEILELLGEGANAAVWHAKDRSLGRDVALKILRGTDAYNDTERRQREERFRQETQAAARLRHPNIVTLLEAGDIDGKPHIVFELIEGVTLREWFGFVSTNPLELAVVASQLADALHYAHMQGIVHRDIKPENILVDLSGKPFIADFGLAQIADKRITEADVSVGTVAYLAPEQANSQAVDGQADVFSLGIVLFEMLTGGLPFRAKTRAEYLAQLAMQDAPSPRQLNRDIHPDLAAICSKCLQRVPGRRYASAKQLHQDLERFANGQPTVARPRTWLARSYRSLVAKPKVIAAMLCCASLLVTSIGIWFWNDYSQSQEFADSISKAREPREVEELVFEFNNAGVPSQLIPTLRERLQGAEGSEEKIKYLYVIDQLDQLADGEKEMVVGSAPENLMGWARLLKPMLEHFDDRELENILQSRIGSDPISEVELEENLNWVALGLLAGKDSYAREAARADEDQRARFLLQSLMANLDFSPNQWLSILDTESSNLFACLIVSAADSLQEQDQGELDLDGITRLAREHPDGAVQSTIRYTKLDIEIPSDESLEQTYREVSGIPFVWIPPQPLEADNADETNSEDLLSKGFWMSTIEIPQSFVVANFAGDEEMAAAVKGISALGPEVAAHWVSVPSAMRICNRLSDLDNDRPQYYSDSEIAAGIPEDKGNEYSTSGFRIPTVREWQWAASAGARTTYFHGAKLENKNRSKSKIKIDFNDYGWFRSSQESSRDSNFRASGLKRPNAWGLYDVYGNVFEIAWNEKTQAFVGCGGFIALEGRKCTSLTVNTMGHPISFGLRPICLKLNMETRNE
ncbi:MAG: protein kinase [Planctomycetota bacterium]